MSEEQIHHTTALGLCNELTQLQYAISCLQHQLVLHYSCNAPGSKTLRASKSLRKNIENTSLMLDELESELVELEE